MPRSYWEGAKKRTLTTHLVAAVPWSWHVHMLLFLAILTKGATISKCIFRSMANSLREKGKRNNDLMVRQLSPFNMDKQAAAAAAAGTTTTTTTTTRRRRRRRRRTRRRRRRRCDSTCVFIAFVSISNQASISSRLEQDKLKSSSSSESGTDTGSISKLRSRMSLEPVATKSRATNRPSQGL